MQWKDTNNFLDFLKMYHEEDRESNWWPAQRFETMQTLELDILFPEFRNTFPPSIMHQDFFCLRDDLPTQPFIIYLVFFVKRRTTIFNQTLVIQIRDRNLFHPIEKVSLYAL